MLNGVPMPEIFMDEDYDKSQTHEFVLQAREDLQFKVDVVIYNENFLNVRYAFVESTSVEIVGPYRAHYGSPRGFYALIQSQGDVALPINLPELDSEKREPSYWLGLGSVRKGFNSHTLKKHELISGTNAFNPQSLYWGPKSYVTMPYLPFFSNCQAFDKYIPIFSVFEQNPSCNLIPPEETIHIRPFGFGSQPYADTCENVTLSCIFDEDLDENNDVVRWFEEGAETLFYITKDPQPASHMDLDSFNTNSNNVRRSIL